MRGTNRANQNHGAHSAHLGCLRLARDLGILGRDILASGRVAGDIG